MAKAKTFNISNFVEDAAESVQVAAQQKKKEAVIKTQEGEETYNMPQEVITPKVEITQTTPMPQNYGVGETVSLKNGEPQKGKRGRKKSLRTIERVNGKIVFLEKGMDADLARLSTFERFDKQDIIRTALFQWLQLHFDGMMLDDSGRREVIAYIQKTTTFEDI